MLYIGNYTDTKTSSTGNVITLTVDLSTQASGANLVLYAETNIAWSGQGFSNAERLHIYIYNSADATEVAHGTFTPTLQHATYNVSYTPPDSGACYAVVQLVWRDGAVPAIQSRSFGVAPVSFNNITFTNIGATTADVSVTTNYDCSSFYWSLDNSTWTAMTANGTTSASASITGLTNSVANTVYFKATRSDILSVGTGSASVTTVGKAVLLAVTDVEADASAPSVTLTALVYDTNYDYELTMGIGNNLIFLGRSITFSNTGTQTVTVPLTSFKSDILDAMPDVTNATADYLLTTDISGTLYESRLEGGVYVTEANSAPEWNSSPIVVANDDETYTFFHGSNLITNGIINGVTVAAASTTGTPSGASAKNGASIDHYYLSIGGIVTESQGYAILTDDPISVSGTSVEIIYGAVDSRGYEVKYTVTPAVYPFTQIYWSATDIARQNGYDDTIEFDVAATFDPLSVTVGGTTYTNSCSSSISGRYSIDGGSNWTSFTVTGTLGSGTLTYNGTPISGNNTPKTTNVQIEITARDTLSSSKLSLTVPNGIPLIQIVDGKITINGDVEINGDLVVNGTITQNTPSTDHTMTIVGNGNVTFCYVVNTDAETPTQYYTNGDTFTITDGGTLYCFVNNAAKRVTVNGDSMPLTDNVYRYTPTTDCTITMTYAINDKSYIDITTL